MRRQVRTAAAGISLFPFLAVLLCTMGALIVVLVVLNRQSRLHAAALVAAEAKSRPAAAEDSQADAELLRDTLAWQVEHLRDSGAKTQADLDHERLRLGGVEEHRRQLETRLTELQRAAAQLDEPEPTDSHSNLTDELARLTDEIASAQQKLADARRRNANSSQVYSVVPYEGPNPTRRRPIYIECSQDRVIIQPEGIVLSAADFDGPMGPGNPLASAIRAARDHLIATAADPKTRDAEPYPLFLVRPDGIEAYYAARAAMQSWGSDFGYQTVDQDWKLEYPAVDSQLAEVQRQAVEEARGRLKWLAQMSPDRYGAGGERRGSGNKVSYRVSPMGGLIREGGPTLRDTTAGSMSSGEEARTGFGSKGRSRPRPADEVVSQEGSTNGSEDRSSGFQPQLAMRSAKNEEHVGRAGVTKEGTAQEQEAGGEQNFPARSPAAKSIERRYGDLNDRSAANDEARGTLPFEAQGSAQSDPETGETNVDVTLNPKPKEKPRSLAETRGVNWGLSPAARASNPITRPIYLVCEGDRLLMRPEQSGEPPVAVPLRLRTEDSVDELVGAVQQRIKDWGIAGRGLYWRPQLILEVGRSGEGRYADLEALLADSGFDVKRR